MFDILATSGIVIASCVKNLTLPLDNGWQVVRFWVLMRLLLR